MIQDSGNLPWHLTLNMKKSKTGRGFAIIEFEDCYGVECSIQKSSSASEDRIWFGANELGLKVMTPYAGWNEVDVTDMVGTDQWIANTRMHLNQEQCKELIEVLQRFVETGEI